MASATSARDKIARAIAETDKVTEPRVTAAGSTPRRKGRKTRLPTRKMLTARLGAAVVAYLDKLTLQQLLCLAYGHTWPVLIPGRGRPRGWRAVLAPEQEGAFLITETCTRDEDGSGRTCGSVRTTYTGAQGIFMERGRHRQYKRDMSIWEIRPEGSRITRLDVIDYITVLMAGELFADEPVLGDGTLL